MKKVIRRVIVVNPADDTRRRLAWSLLGLLGGFEDSMRQTEMSILAMSKQIQREFEELGEQEDR